MNNTLYSNQERKKINVAYLQYLFLIMPFLIVNFNIYIFICIYFCICSKMSSLKINHHLIHYFKKSIILPPPCEHKHNDEDKFCNVCGNSLAIKYEDKKQTRFMSKQIVQVDHPYASKYTKSKYDQFNYKYEWTPPNQKGFPTTYTTYSLSFRIDLSYDTTRESDTLYQPESVIHIQFEKQFLDYIRKQRNDSTISNSMKEIQDISIRKLYDECKWDIMQDIQDSITKELKEHDPKIVLQFSVGDVSVITFYYWDNRD